MEFRPAAVGESDQASGRTLKRTLAPLRRGAAALAVNSPSEPMLTWQRDAPSLPVTSPVRKFVSPMKDATKLECGDS